MKIGVYTIALNEEQFVEKWFNSVKDADEILIADTGSTDRTVKIAKKLGIRTFSIRVNPWRFDVARNTALSLLSHDIDFCISLDMDEVIVGDIKKAFEDMSPEITRPNFNYVWSWKPNGTPDKVYNGDKTFHRRFGYMWVSPVHEMLTPYGLQEVRGPLNLEVHHFPDKTKSRGQYFELLKMAVRELPDPSRHFYWLAREYIYKGDFGAAQQHFLEFLERFPNAWKPERAWAYRYLAQCQVEKAEEYLQKAIKEAPNFREPFYDLAMHYSRQKDWNRTLEYAEKALQLELPPPVYICDQDIWKGTRLLAIAAEASHELKNRGKALAFLKRAMQIEPDNSFISEKYESYRDFN